MHRLAFHNAVLQEVLSDLEAKLLAGRWAQCRVERPVFIASLPRAGTTVLLEILHRLPDLSSHTYRDMPFLLTPVLWNSVSSTFQRRGTIRERAHGDGLAVSEDSPEAFEEVLWKKFYPCKYACKQIHLWKTDDADRTFVDFFRTHMRKVIALRDPDSPAAGRYLSKNNANIARIELLLAMFPDADILVPVRNPVEHAVSMLRQHRNFTERHATDPFTQEYMEDIGHYEFGSLHKPIAFPALDDLTRDLDPGSLAYWLAYWISAFGHLAGHQGADFVCFEALRSAGESGIARLAQHLDVPADNKQLANAAGVLRPAATKRGDDVPLPHHLKERAVAIYDSLRSQCLLTN